MTRQIDLALHYCEFAVIPLHYMREMMVAFTGSDNEKEIGQQYKQHIQTGSAVFFCLDDGA